MSIYSLVPDLNCPCIIERNYYTFVWKPVGNKWLIRCCISSEDFFFSGTQVLTCGIIIRLSCALRMKDSIATAYEASSSHMRLLYDRSLKVKIGGVRKWVKTLQSMIVSVS